MRLLGGLVGLGLLLLMRLLLLMALEGMGGGGLLLRVERRRWRRGGRRGWLRIRFLLWRRMHRGVFRGRRLGGTLSVRGRAVLVPSSRHCLGSSCRSIWLMGRAGMCTWNRRA